MSNPSGDHAAHSVPPSAPDMALARKARQELANRHAQAFRGSEVTVRFVAQDQPCDVVLPVAAVRLLVDILGQMANGHAVTVTPVDSELTTTQAAAFLNVSRPFVTKLLQQGVLPFRRVGTHRRVRFQDVLKYKEKSEVGHRQALADLVSQAQKLDLGYGDVGPHGAV
jgi:excisionase family DNA binding protein